MWNMEEWRYGSEGEHWSLHNTRSSTAALDLVSLSFMFHTIAHYSSFWAFLPICGECSLQSQIQLGYCESKGLHWCHLSPVISDRKRNLPWRCLRKLCRCWLRFYGSSITGAKASFLPLLMSLWEEHCADVRLIVFVNVSTLICHKLNQQGSCHF